MQAEASHSPVMQAKSSRHPLGKLINFLDDALGWMKSSLQKLQNLVSRKDIKGKVLADVRHTATFTDLQARHNKSQPKQSIK